MNHKIFLTCKFFQQDFDKKYFEINEGNVRRLSLITNYKEAAMPRMKAVMIGQG